MTADFELGRLEVDHVMDVYNQGVLYLVKWLNLSDSCNSWECKCNLSGHYKVEAYEDLIEREGAISFFVQRESPVELDSSPSTISLKNDKKMGIKVLLDSVCQEKV